jgi:AraC-like DNA-binding protein
LAYSSYFGIEPEYEAEINAVFITQEELKRPLPAGNAELARQNDQVVVDFLAKLKKLDLPSRVQKLLIEMLPSGECTNTKIAFALNMSVKTRYNKLQQSGTSYQAILDTTRRRLAIEYVILGNLQVSEIAYVLGFGDCSNFSRAFKNWTGLSPTKFRVDHFKEDTI